MKLNLNRVHMSKTLESKKRILNLLKKNDMTVSELSEQLNLSYSTTAQHIEELKRIGAVEHVKNQYFRKMKYYKPTPQNNPVFKYLLATAIIFAAIVVLYLHFGALIHGNGISTSHSVNTSGYYAPTIVYAGNMIKRGNVTIALTSISTSADGQGVASIKIYNNGVLTNETSIESGQSQEITSDGMSFSILVNKTYSPNSTGGWASIEIPNTNYTSTTIVTTSSLSTSTATTTIPSQPEYYLVMTASNNSGSCLSPGGTFYPNGNIITISALSTCNGQSFIGWKGIGAGSYSGASPTATIIMSRNITEIANYTPSTIPQSDYYLQIGTRNSFGGCISPGSNFYPRGLQMAISASSNCTGQSFISWNGTGAGSYSGVSPTGTIIMNGNITEIATYSSQTITSTTTISTSTTIPS